MLCDRGTLDGLAYWPSAQEAFFEQLNTSHEAELARYSSVIHLETPAVEHYNHDNPLRLESPTEAAAIDRRIREVWEDHPNRVSIDSAEDFFDKAQQALRVIGDAIPACCRDSGREVRS